MADELLSQAELETLLSKAAPPGAAKAAASPLQIAPAPHAPAFRDAAKPVRAPLSSLVDAQQLAMLRARHESFGRKLSAALSAWLRLVVEVRLHSVDASTLGEMADALEKPTFCQLLRAAPLAQRCVVDLPLDLLYIILDRLLGGGREPAVAMRRPPTEIELRLASRITALVVTELQAAWQGMLQIELSADRVETDDRWLTATLRTESTLLFAFEVKLSDARGVLRLAIPLAALKHLGQPTIAVRDDSADASQRAAPVVDASMQTAGHGPRIHGSAKQADSSIELTACLAVTTITAQDLQQLQPGDIIATEQPADGLIDVYQDGELVYQAQLGSYQGQKAIQIERVVSGPTTESTP